MLKLKNQLEITLSSDEVWERESVRAEIGLQVLAVCTVGLIIRSSKLQSSVVSF